MYFLKGMLTREQKEKTLYLTAFSLIGFEKAIGICPLQVSLVEWQDFKVTQSWMEYILRQFTLLYLVLEKGKN